MWNFIMSLFKSDEIIADPLHPHIATNAAGQAFTKRNGRWVFARIKESNRGRAHDVIEVRDSYNPNWPRTYNVAESILRTHQRPAEKHEYPAMKDTSGTLALNNLRWASTAIIRNEMEPPSSSTGSSNLDELSSLREADVKHIRSIPTNEACYRYGLKASAVLDIQTRVIFREVL
jgi:hypothetical protein